MDPVIIVGTGVAGYSLAREFRKLDKTTPLMMITADDGRSYPKPMLSNALTRGKTADQIALSDANAMANTLEADILTKCVVDRIDPQARIVTTSNSKPMKYSQLVLAIGASPIRIPIVGSAADDVLSVNNLSDYSVFRDKLIDAKHVTLIGPGLIGCEFANDLANLDVKVSVIGPNKYPMDSLLPELIAKELKLNLEKIGVEWRLGTIISAITHESNGYKLMLTNGDVLHTNMIVSAVGLRSNINLAKDAGLDVGLGIVTDKLLLTSQPHIYALGDCAEVAGYNLLFIAPIMAAAKSLAKTLSGKPTAVKYAAMPVAIKTPCYPLVVCAPERGIQGNWQFETAVSGFGIKALYTDTNKNLKGFILSGDLVGEKTALAKQVPDLLS